MTSANQLTLLRILSVPIFVGLVAFGSVGAALAVFVLAGATDLLDGLVARKYGQRTALGRFLDPLADKLLMVGALVVLSLENQALEIQVPHWLTLSVVARDLILGIAALSTYVFTGTKAFPPSMLGKLSTLAQFTTILAVLVDNVIPWRMPFHAGLFGLTALVTVGSGVQYLVRGVRVLACNRG